MAVEEPPPTHPLKMPPHLPDEKHLHKQPALPPPYPQGRRYPSTGDRRLRPLCIFIVAALFLIGTTALTVWLLYHPHRPSFKVVSAAVYQLNTSSPPFIYTTMQFTVVATNPNNRISILYDPLSAYVSYKNLAITQPVALPPLFQDTRSTVTLSPTLGGAPVEAEAEVGNTLAMDEAYGVVGLRLVITGKLRYKGAIKSGRRGVHVVCDLLVSIRSGFVGQQPVLGSTPCKVYV